MRSVFDRNVVMRRMTVLLSTLPRILVLFSTRFVVAVLPYYLLYILHCCHLPPSVAHGTIIFCFSCVASEIHLLALPRGVRSMTRMSDVCEVRTAQGMWHTSCLSITLCWLRNKTHYCKDTVCVAYCRPVDWFAWICIGFVTYIMAVLRKLVVQYLTSLSM